ncbi:hypothetical protein P3T73_16575 [Kiritimatiellota bacterium B12222]|nr:hypothetical protein P3T73_16575 [Kiritimatiellota bacterium B12222]
MTLSFFQQIKKKFAQPAQYGWVALIILILAMSLRVVGIRHGDPIWIYHPDVAKQAYVAQDAFGEPYAPAKNRFRNVERAYYPYGDSVLLSDALRILQPLLNAFDLTRERLQSLHVWQWAFMLRIFSVVLFGIALVLFTLFAWPGASRWMVLTAALLLCVEPLNAQYSHYGMNDVPLAALLMLLWVASPSIRKDRGVFPWRSFLLGGLLGIAFGVKYQAVVAAIIPGMVWLLLYKEKSLCWRCLVPVVMGVGCVLGALYACPPLRMPASFVTHFPEFMAWQADITGEQLSLANKISRNVVLLADYLFLQGYVLFFIPWVLFFIQARKGGWGRSTLLMGYAGAAFSACLLLVFICCRDFLRSNDMVALVPFWVWPVGLLFYGARPVAPQKIYQHISRISYVSLCVLAVFWITHSWRDSLALARPDTRELARVWAVENVKAGDRILLESYTVPTRIPEVEELRVPFLAFDPLWSQVQNMEFDYLFTASLAYNRFGDNCSPYFDPEMKARYEQIDTLYERGAEFKDRELYYAHPHITVYRAR